MKFKVSSHDHGMTLIAFLRASYPDAPSVKALKRAIDSKQCTINGRVETFSTHKVKAGDEIVLELVKSRSLKSEKIWEDDVLVAYNKPAGVVSEPKNFKGHLVHRLDKETSGIILVAKTKDILEKMIELFRQKKVIKKYLAIVDGVVQKTKGTIVSNLAPKHRFQGQTIYGSNLKGQYAETRYVIARKAPKATLLECYPITGRTHQLRVHLQEAGHPIVGDYQYARHFKCGYKSSRHLLHAEEISFPHPLTQENITVTAPLPDDFEQALKALLL